MLRRWPPKYAPLMREVEGGFDLKLTLVDGRLLKWLGERRWGRSA